MNNRSGLNSSTINMEDGTLLITMNIINMSLAVALNSLVLVVIHRQRELQDGMRFMYQILTTLYLFLGVCWNAWYLTAIWWSCTNANKLFSLLFHAAVMLLMACLCGIHFVLYVIISQPLHYNTIITMDKIKISVIVTSILTLLLNVTYLPIPGWPFIEIEINEFCLFYMDQEAIEDIWWYIKLIFDVTPPISALVFIFTIQIHILKIVRKQTRAVADMDMEFVDRHRNREELNVEEFDTKYCCKRPIQIEVLRFYKKNKGTFTVLLLTCSIFFAWIPYILVHYFFIYEIVYVDLIASSGTWIQPIVYLITNYEARIVCRHLFTLHSRAQLPWQGDSNPGPYQMSHLL